MDYSIHISSRSRHEDAQLLLARRISVFAHAEKIGHLFSDDAPASDGEDAPLDEAVREEREYVRRRLREELGREPTGEEIDEWLRQQTEGF